MHEIVREGAIPETREQENLPATRGQLIRNARRLAELSQAELGLLMGQAMDRPRPFSQAAISDIERGRRNYSESELGIIAHVLNIPESQLIGAPPGPASKPSWRITSIGKSEKSNIFGLTDTLRIKGTKYGLELHFTSEFTSKGEKNKRSVMLSKCPNPLVGAMEMVLNSRVPNIHEYSGENFSGRVLSVEDEGRLKYSWVAEFSSPKMAGFLIHLNRQQMETLRKELLNLPAHPLPTD